MAAGLPAREMDVFLTQLLRGDRRGAERYAREIFETHGVRFLYEEVVRSALRDVGELWRMGKIGIADEHLATATAQTAIAALYPSFAWKLGGPVAVIGCIHGERHDFGARMFADLLALDGWDERLLGPDVPVDDFVSKVKEVKGTLAALSVTTPEQARDTRKAVSLVRRAVAGVKVIVGGGAANELRDMVTSGEVDAVVSSAVEGVEVARAWK